MDFDQLRAQYDEHGFVRLPAAFPAEAAAVMADRIWALLARRHDIDRHDPATWTVVTPHGLAPLRERGVFDALGTTAVADAITALLGREDWPRPAAWGAALVTFPTPGEWTVPAGGWHIDWPTRGAPGSQLLTKWLGFASCVEPGGGGTVVLAGSHHLVAKRMAGTDPTDPGSSRAVRDAIFAMDDRLGDLRRLMDEGATVLGVPIRVVELTGSPGDVTFLHPHVLHAAAANCRSQPRFMIMGQVVEVAS